MAAAVTGDLAGTMVDITGTGDTMGILTGGGVPHFGHTTIGALGATLITADTIIPITGDTTTLIVLGIILMRRILITVAVSTIIIS